MTVPAHDHEDRDQHGYALPYHWCQPRFYRSVVEEAVRRLDGVVRGRSVLEVGCGDGFVTSLFAKRATSVVGFDLNARAIEFARLIVRDPNVRFEVGRAADITAIATSAGDVEVVAAMEVVEHLSGRERTAFLEGVVGVLRARGGGALVLTTPNGAKRPGGRANPHHAQEFTARELADLLRSSGFEGVAVSGLYLQPSWTRLEHFADVVPFRALFRRLVQAGAERPDRCRTLVCVARVPGP